MLNAIGLQGIGVRRFVDEKLPELRARGATVIVNVCGTTLDEYVEVSRILSDAEGVAAIELNISCPNIKEGGIQFGCSLTGTFDVVSAVRKVTRLPVIPKLTPNVTDVASFARAAEDAGADAVSLVNTFLAMVIDVETRRPKISNVVGGLSGPAIRPIAVRMVYECRQTVKIPDHRHGRHRGRARRARVHDRRRVRRAGRHGQLRRSVHLAEAARRHRRLHAAASDRSASTDLVGTRGHDQCSRAKELDRAGVNLLAPRVSSLRRHESHRRARRRAMPLSLEEIDISGDPALEALYGLEIPVLMIGGRKAAKYRIAEDELRRLLLAREAGTGWMGRMGGREQEG